MTLPIDRVAPELRGPVGRMPHMPFGSRIGRWLIRRALRLMPAADLGDVRLEVIEDGAARLRLYHPPERRSDGALLWIHGGGYLIGAPMQDDRLCADTARTLGIVVASVGYRLAPEHPFPAPLDDCLAGWRWLRAAAARLGVDPARIAIGGQSAGGGLAAALVQRVHDLGEGAKAQLLLCPMLDDRTATDRSLDAIGHRIWSNANNRAGWRAYLGRAPSGADVPPYAAAARRADLTSLPPAWIGVGTIDLFHDEDLAYADRLRSAGIDVTVRTVPGAPHGFEAWAPDTAIARDFLADARDWLGRALAA